MKEYIERESLIKIFTTNEKVDKVSLSFVRAVIKNAVPAADVVEVVRCKDCRHMTLEMGYVRFCNVWERPNGMGDDGFCNYGELRADA